MQSYVCIEEIHQGWGTGQELPESLLTLCFVRLEILVATACSHSPQSSADRHWMIPLQTPSTAMTWKAFCLRRCQNKLDQNIVSFVCLRLEIVMCSKALLSHNINAASNSYLLTSLLKTSVFKWNTKDEPRWHTTLNDYKASWDSDTFGESLRCISKTCERDSFSSVP